MLLLILCDAVDVFDVVVECFEGSLICDLLKRGYVKFSNSVVRHLKRTKNENWLMHSKVRLSCFEVIRRQYRRSKYKRQYTFYDHSEDNRLSNNEKVYMQAYSSGAVSFSTTKFRELRSQLAFSSISIIIQWLNHSRQRLDILCIITSVL